MSYGANLEQLRRIAASSIRALQGPFTHPQIEHPSRHGRPPALRGGIISSTVKGVHPTVTTREPPKHARRSSADGRVRKPSHTKQRCGFYFAFGASSPPHTTRR